MLDYKDIITKHYGLGMSGMAIAKSLNASPSGVNDFLRAFKECKSLGYPLPQGITNYGIAEAVYGKNPAIAGRDLSYEMPNYEAVAKDMSSRKNMVHAANLTPEQLAQIIAMATQGNVGAYPEGMVSENEDYEEEDRYNDET